MRSAVGIGHICLSLETSAIPGVLDLHMLEIAIHIILSHSILEARRLCDSPDLEDAVAMLQSICMWTYVILMWNIYTGKAPEARYVARHITIKMCSNNKKILALNDGTIKVIQIKGT